MDGGLIMYGSKPEKMSNFFEFDTSSDEQFAVWPLPEEMLPEVTWENSPKIFIVRMDFFQFKDRIRATE